jgi:hypothetical protein
VRSQPKVSAEKLAGQLFGPGTLATLHQDWFGLCPACPDFSAEAAPIHFGFVTSAEISPGASPGSTVRGIDNWLAPYWTIAAAGPILAFVGH